MKPVRHFLPTTGFAEACARARKRGGISFLSRRTVHKLIFKLQIEYIYRELIIIGLKFVRNPFILQSYAALALLENGPERVPG